MLILEVEFLTGVCVSASPYERDEPEWPPHPDRLFQALVAAWGRNEEPREDERAALEWLEGLDSDTFVVSAPYAHPRDVVAVHVPANDLATPERQPAWAKALTSGRKLSHKEAKRATKVRDRDLSVVPEMRTARNPRFFPATIPAAERPVVRYIWQRAEGLDQHRAALTRLAREVTYLGHSHTLVRVALVEDYNRDWDDAWIHGGPSTLRVPHPGRLKDLTQSYKEGVRPRPSLVLRQFTPRPGQETPHTWFDPGAIILRGDEGDFVPAADAFPLVAKRLRDALLKTAEQERLRIPVLLSGHNPDGSPAETPHLAIVPLADVGWAYSQGGLMGIALVWPRDTASDERRSALRAVAGFVKRGAELRFGQLGTWRLILDADPALQSLRFERYTRCSCRWATVLPAVLDRYPKSKSGANLAAIMEQACMNIGLAREAVDGLQVEAYTFSAVRGAPSVHEVKNQIAKDSPYRNRPMRHLVLTFKRPVQGPLILGAGRYRGLGLCLPLREEVRR